MKTTAMKAIMLMAVAAASGESTVPAADRRVNVCIERSALFGVAGQAQKTASQMLAGIDMTVTALQPRY